SKPWRYLWLIITNTQNVPQPVKLDIDIKTVVDMQKLVGAIGWLRPYLAIINHQLQHLYDLLSGITPSTNERHLTAAAKKAVEEIELALTSKFVTRIDVSVDMMKYHADRCVNGMINGKIICIFWSGYFCLLGPEKQLQVCTSFLQTSLSKVADAAMRFRLQIAYHLPSHTILNFTKRIPFQGKLLLLFCASERCNSFYRWIRNNWKNCYSLEDDHWEYEVMVQQGSPQLSELCSLLLAFTLFPSSVNIVTDSVYVANLVKQLDQDVLYNVKEKPLFVMFLKLWTVIHNQKHSYFIMHIRSHTSLPGFFV
ncbi:hypothetical protein EK904_000291, partial [Melospiza melodia maxima]